jgi:peptide/histidine transporter 3/4
MFVPVILDITQTRLKAWSIQFGILAACNIVATLVFLSGIRNYDIGIVEICSPLTMVARVLFACASKISQPLPDDPTYLYKIIPIDDPTALPHTGTLRFLDKAAILLPTKSQEEQKKSRWTLCGVTEVEVTKRLILMLPICTTFFICAIVIAIGNTYFIEQANNMDRRLGRIKVPLTFFLVLYKFIKSSAVLLSELYDTIFVKLGFPGFNYLKTIIITVIAELCLVIAAIMERRRLSVTKEHKADETIPMSVFNLLPQFFFLAILEGFFSRRVYLFFYSFTPEYIGDYWVYFHKGVMGLGTMSGGLAVYLIGKFCQMGNRPNWFQYTLNQSRLDYYYWTLAVLLAVNFLFYCFITYFSPLRDIPHRVLETETETEAEAEAEAESESFP